MSKSAVMGEPVHRAFEAPKNVEIRRFGGKRHGRGGKSSLAVESGACKDGAGQEVSDWFQSNSCTTDNVETAASAVWRSKARD